MTTYPAIVTFFLYSQNTPHIYRVNFGAICSYDFSFIPPGSGFFSNSFVNQEVTMSTEQGIVKQVEPGWAWVKAKRLGATGGCGCYDHCHTIEGGNKMVIKAVNLAQAREGDVVVLYLSTSAKFKCLATIYLLPVFGLFAGAFSSNYLSHLIGLNPSWGMALFTIAGVVAAVALMRFLANRMAHQERFTPIVKRIIRPAFEPINLN